MSKILLINGSPNEYGCTDAALWSVRRSIMEAPTVGSRRSSTASFSVWTRRRLPVNWVLLSYPAAAVGHRQRLRG